jgi:hypothetical protein
MSVKTKVARRTFKPFISCLPGLGEISYIREKTPYSPRTIVVDSYLTLLWHPLRPEIVGVKVTQVPAIALGTRMPVNGMNVRPLSFMCFLDYAREHANNCSDEPRGANKYRDTLYAIAKGVVGYAKIDHRKLRAVARPR